MVEFAQSEYEYPCSSSRTVPYSETDGQNKTILALHEFANALENGHSYIKITDTISFQFHSHSICIIL
jgi:hypothetical protein